MRLLLALSNDFGYATSNNGLLTGKFGAGSQLLYPGRKVQPVQEDAP